MATQRAVTVERCEPGRFAAVNQRGGRVMFGTGTDGDFTPTELLLAAIAGCTAIDVDILTSRRRESDSFVVEIGADKIRERGRQPAHRHRGAVPRDVPGRSSG